MKLHKRHHTVFCSCGIILELKYLRLFKVYFDTPVTLVIFLSRILFTSTAQSFMTHHVRKKICTWKQGFAHLVVREKRIFWLLKNAHKHMRRFSEILL